MTLPVTIATWDLDCNVPSEAFAVGCGESLGARWLALLTAREIGQVPSNHQLYSNAANYLHVQATSHALASTRLLTRMAAPSLYEISHGTRHIAS